MSEIVNLTTLNYVFSFLVFMDCCGTECTTNDLRFSDFGFRFSQKKNCTKLMLPSKKKWSFVHKELKVPLQKNHQRFGWKMLQAK